MPLMNPKRAYGAWASAVLAGVVSLSGAVALSASAPREIAPPQRGPAPTADNATSGPPAMAPGSVILPSAPPLARATPVNAEVLSRPLFTPSRRPSARGDGADAEAPPAAAEASNGAPDDWKLVGTMTTRNQHRALIRLAGRPGSVWVQSGDAIEGWTVQSVTASAVVLSSPQGERRIELYPKPVAEAARPNPQSR